MVRTICRSSDSVRAPATLYSASLVVPSPSATISIDRWIQSFSRCSTNSSYRRSSVSMTGFSAIPLQIIPTMSLFDVSPSTVIMLIVLSTTCLSDLSSSLGSLAIAYIIYDSMFTISVRIIHDYLESLDDHLPQCLDLQFRIDCNIKNYTREQGRHVGMDHP